MRYKDKKRSISAERRKMNNRIREIKGLDEEIEPETQLAEILDLLRLQEVAFGDLLYLVEDNTDEVHTGDG